MSDKTLTDREMLELAAKAAGYLAHFDCVAIIEGVEYYYVTDWDDRDVDACWNPLHDDGDRYRLIRKLKINIDFADCCAWKRLPNGGLIQEFWGEEYGDEPHAVVRAAAEIGRLSASRSTTT